MTFSSYTETARIEQAALPGRKTRAITVETIDGQATISTYDRDGSLEGFYPASDLPIETRRAFALALLNGEPLDAPEPESTLPTEYGAYRDVDGDLWLLTSAGWTVIVADGAIARNPGLIEDPTAFLPLTPLVPTTTEGN